MLDVAARPAASRRSPPGRCRVSAPTREEALAVLSTPDDELLSLLAAAFRVRRRHFGHR